MTDYDAISVVIRSRYREEVVDQLSDRPKTPKQITDAGDGNRMDRISRAIQTLRDEGLVELLVDEDTNKGRIYGLTESGEEVADHLSEVKSQQGESAA